jgi:hypothetical protein
MGVFKDEHEVYRYIGGIFEATVADPELGPKFAASGVILRVEYTDPESVLSVDLPKRQVLYGLDARNGPKPVVSMWMKADVAHQYWLGNVNVSVALARGQMKAKGPIAKILKLVRLTKALVPRYKTLLLDNGRADLVDA